MILELRTYDYAPGKALAYLDLFAREGLPLITRYLPLAGYWLAEAGVLNRLVHLWVYRDWSDRAERRARFMSDRDWTEGFLPRGLALISRQESQILEIVAASPEAEVAFAAADQVHAATSPALRQGWLTIGPFEPDKGNLLSARVIAGPATGQVIHLARPDDPMALRCDAVLRPAAFSPL